MPNPDDLRDLIQQVADAGGPLRLNEDDVVVGPFESPRRGRVQSLDEHEPEALDVLAGVLRRDMWAAGATQIGTDEYTTLDRGPETRYGAHASFGKVRVAAYESDWLRAFLRLWLTAHERGLVGRQEGVA